VTSCGEDDGGPYVVTGATVFYPGGGGQEPDKGMIIHQAADYPVLKAVLHGGQMRHYIGGKIATGQQVTIRVDAEHRMQNARLHTAGHLLSSVVHEKLQWPLLPVKGFHYQQGAYVEFERAEPEGAFCLERLQEALSEEISRDLAVSAAFVAADEDAFEQAVKPQGFLAPAGRPLRIVRIDPYRAYPCGGTHLVHTGQLQWIRITHLRHKKGNIRISYEAG
jgi:alanyl-tRNA synthetase